MIIRTVCGYDFFEVSSAMQKAIRRADTGVAGFLHWNFGRVGTATMCGSVCLPLVLKIAMESLLKR